VTENTIKEEKERKRRREEEVGKKNQGMRSHGDKSNRSCRSILFNRIDYFLFDIRKSIYKSSVDVTSHP
jgi:hypothetical protein